MTDPNSTPPQMTPVWTTPPPYVYGYPYQVQPPKTTNGMAIAAMVVSIVGAAGVCAWGPLSIFVSPVGAILGHVARRQIKVRDEQGGGMALAGIIVGWIGFVIALAYLALFILLFVKGDELFPPDPTYSDEF